VRHVQEGPGLAEASRHRPHGAPHRGPAAHAQRAEGLDPRRGAPIRRWLNTSGQSYRALGGREHFDTLDDASIAAALAADGKLVKRPVLVVKRGAKVVVRVGFDADAWQELLG
jgi:hypothetical protein